MEFFLKAIFISFFGLCLSYVFVKSYLSFANKYNLLSGQNDLNVPNKIVPTSAGLALACAFFVTLYPINFLYPIQVSYLLSILMGASFMTVMGFLDDLKNISAFIKILFQFIFSLGILYIFGADSIYVGLNEVSLVFLGIFFILFLIWIINTFNFIDGADGLLASNCSLICCLLFFFFFSSNNEFLSLIAISLGSISMGFLKFNWTPASAFMGDSGSLFFGSMFVVLICGSIFQEILSIWTWLIILSIFYVETTVTLIIRLIRKENFFSGRHELHAYQKLVIKTQDHSSPSKAFIAIQSLWTIPASLLSFYFPEYNPLIYFITILPMIIGFYHFGPRKS